MSIAIRAPGSFTQDTFEGAASFHDDGSELLIVDLRRCWFIDIFVMVMLLTITTLRRSQGWPVRMLLPKQAGARTYLGRMRFFRLLPEGVEMDAGPPDVAERESWLVPLTRVDMHAGEHGIEELCRFTYPQLPAQLAYEFTEALAEICANVIHHAQAEVGFVAGQRFEKAFPGRPGPRLLLVVADAGIGIRTSLATANLEIASMADEHAILEALKEGVTGKPGSHSGVGLTTVREYADVFGGVMRIRSGAGTVVIRRGRPAAKAVPGLPGTIVSVELCSPG